MKRRGGAGIVASSCGTTNIIGVDVQLSTNHMTIYHSTLRAVSGLVVLSLLLLGSGCVTPLSVKTADPGAEEAPSNPTPSQPSQVFKTYLDPDSGLSFKYPEVWGIV